MKGIKFISVQSALPKRCVTNDDLSKLVDTSDEWISSRTGIRSRYFVTDETNADLATEAARRAIEASAIRMEDIACCVVATFTPDNFTPSVACKVVGNLGLPQNIPAFDINAACAGFIYGLNVVRGLLLSQPGKYGLLIGSEVISRLLDFEDRNTCVLFGDGAGAAVVKLTDDNRFSFICETQSDDQVLYSRAFPGNGLVYPSIQMQGSEVFRFAVESVCRCIEQILIENKLTLKDIDHVVCHQANQRIIARVQKNMAIPEEKIFMNLYRYGNTSAASIPIALADMSAQQLLKEGDKILCVGFGAGLVWGGVLIEW